MPETPALAARLYKRHLRGWLAYAFAYEVFAIVSLTLFLPICLEQFARDNGFFAPEHKEPCAQVASPQDERRCVVRLGWLWVDTASFSLYVFSISVALQALTVISIGGMADKASHRKSLLLSLAAIGSIATILFLPLSSTSAVWALSGLLAITANVCFGASVVANNAYLPGLARESFEVVKARDAMLEEEGASDNIQEVLTSQDMDDDSRAPLLSGQHPNPIAPSSKRVAYENALSLATARLSSLGIALGFTAGICCLLLTFIPVTILKGSTFSLRVAIGASGFWWAIFSVPAGIWLPSGASSPATSTPEKMALGREIGSAWKRLGQMLHPREIRRLRYTFVYLAAWFLLSDGFTTITSTAILFAKTTLHMPPSSLVLIGVLTPLSGIIGSLVIPRIQRALKWTNLTVLVLLVTGASLVPLYPCLGFIPVFRDGKLKFGGLTTPGEMYALAVYFGVIYGAFQGYARAFFAELIPPGEEARWFALFSITDKSSSFIGPLFVGLIADLTGNIRFAFFFVVSMVWAALPFLLLINVDKGKRDAQSYVSRPANEES